MNDCKHLRRSDWQCLLETNRQYMCPWDDCDKPKNLCNWYGTAKKGEQVNTMINYDGLKAINTLIELCRIKKQQFDGECGDCPAEGYCGSTIYGWRFKRDNK